MPRNWKQKLVGIAAAGTLLGFLVFGGASAKPTHHSHGQPKVTVCHWDDEDQVWVEQTIAQVAFVQRADEHPLDFVVSDDAPCPPVEATVPVEATP